MNQQATKTIWQRTEEWLVKYRGYLMVITAATLWGVQGNVAQILLQKYYFSPEWLVSVRMGVSGMLLLLFLLFKNGSRHLLTIWQHPKDRFHIIVFGILGMLAVQYSFFVSIKLGNAAISALLQYLAPSMVMMYVAFTLRSWPKPRELVAIGIALLGVYLLITNGKNENFSVPMSAVIWGVISAATLAFYTLYPKGLLQRYGSGLVVGWSMIIGGVSLSLIFPLWRFAGELTPLSLLLLFFVVTFGTLVPFTLYLNSLKYISPSATSILTCIEPLTATVIAVLLLQVTLGSFEILGALLIIATVFVLPKEEKGTCSTTKHRGKLNIDT